MASPAATAYSLTRSRAARVRWPRSAAHARGHAILAALVLWTLLVVTFAVGSRDRSFAGPIKGADFLQFYTAGHLVRTHQFSRLYDMAALHDAQVALVPESGPDRYPPVYPPQVAAFFAPFSLLPYRGALLLWTLVSAAAYALIVRSAWRPVAGSLSDGRFVFFAAAAFPPFWSLMLHGQMSALVLAAFWAGWRALERGERFRAGCALGLLLIKPQFAIALVVVAVACREWRLIAGALTSAVVQVAAILIVFGTSVVHAYVSFVPVMVRYADLLEPKPYQSHSLRAITRLLPSWAGMPLWIAAVAALMLAAVRVWQSAAPARVRMGVIILVSVLVNPHLIVYDATVLVLPLLWLGAAMMDAGQADDTRTYWTVVYWLCVALLAPTAAIAGVQASVILMIGILVLFLSRFPAGNLLPSGDSV